MRRVKLELCYDGAGYSGWQIQPRQPKVRTIQGELERSIRRVVGHEVEVLGSGRTDAGVHALCQVAAFNTDSELPPETLVRAINAFLPPNIRIWRASYVDLNFHPIRDVVRKRYRYLASDSRPAFPFFRQNVWNLIQKVDDGAMREAGSYLLGTRDMKAFQSQGSPRNSTVRTIFDVKVERASADEAFRFPKLNEWERGKNVGEEGQSLGASQYPSSPELIVFELEADGFLYNMVRAIVGTLCFFGKRHKGFEDPERMREIIASADRKFAGPTAPPHGLYMIDVIYPDDLDASGR
ncbi:MAG: tRNA pseudouridine synthase A [Thermoguttaceae bacterium]|jgi:tRNA pseudouridine38-40 synthase